MRLQFRKRNISCLECVVREIKSTEITQELRLSDGLPDIGRVLTCWGQILLRSKQWQSNEISLSGGVKLWVLYAPEDGTEPRVAEGWLPFQLEWDIPDGSKEGPVRMIPLLRFADSRSAAARKMMLRAGVSVLAQGFSRMDAELYAPDEVPEDVQVLQNSYPVRLPVEAGEKTFLQDEDVDLMSTSGPDLRLISYTVSPEVTESRILSDRIAIKGNSNLHVVYRDADGRVDSKHYDLPFSQLINLDHGWGLEARADVRIGVTDLEADLNENGQLRMKCGMVAQYLIDDQQVVELAEDSYSPLREVTPDQSELLLPAVLDERNESICAEQTLNGMNGQPADIRCYPDYPRIRRNEGTADLEIPGVYQVLFYGDDGTLQCGSVRWEAHFQLPMDSSCQMVSYFGMSVPPRASNGQDGMILSCDLKMTLRTASTHGMPMVTGLELGELRQADPERPSLVIRRQGSDSLWEIAKKYGSTVSAIRNANVVACPNEQDRMLLIPVS